MKRLMDIVIAAAALILLAPVLVAAATGIWLASPGPIFYRAVRVGRGGDTFEMVKFRTMHQASSGGVITSRGDARIFPLGRLLRKLKIDELPQFWNVLKGDMSIVGPRPEDPKIVRDHYSHWMRETLRVRPGITSVGAIFYYSEGEGLIDDQDPEGSYVERLLPPKLALERAYMEREDSLWDLRCMVMTAIAIVAAAIGRPLRVSERDLEAATQWVPRGAFPRQAVGASGRSSS